MLDPTLFQRLSGNVAVDGELPSHPSLVLESSPAPHLRDSLRFNGQSNLKGGLHSEVDSEVLGQPEGPGGGHWHFSALG